MWASKICKNSAVHLLTVFQNMGYLELLSSIHHGRERGLLPLVVVRTQERWRRYVQARRRTPGGPLPSLAPVQVTMVTQWPPYTLTSCQTGLGSTGSNQDTDLKLHFYFDLKIWISHRMRFLQGNDLLFETSIFVKLIVVQYQETRTLVHISTQAKYNI